MRTFSFSAGSAEPWSSIRSFEDVRHHAVIRVLTEGVRRTELAQMEVSGLLADLIARPFAQVVPLKGARSYREGRIVPVHAADRAGGDRLPGSGGPAVRRAGRLVARDVAPVDSEKNSLETSSWNARRTAGGKRYSVPVPSE